ncbi:MAG TPA: hypothetical protein PLJ95_03245 [Candidatus Hydrogenedentes bacterium]|jgi:hypothetical protein|nr:MAG: hypothetical protein BWY07_02558 [Candidatus Hydrogenedentes bacterium ADurb.Bin170]HPK24089.1 hypothetical protein [Candidatus Hydrogenedentota bacterium]
MMETNETKSLFPWISGAAVILLGVTVVALFMSDHRPEPGTAFRFDVAGFQERSKADGIYEETGNLPLPLERPTAAAPGAEGTFFAAARDKIIHLNPDGSVLQEFAVSGVPRCLVSGNENRLYAGVDGHIEVWSLGGDLLESWQPAGEKSWLTSLLLHEENLYSADAGLRCVLRYDLSGALLQRIGEKDAGRDIPGLIVPTPFLDIAVDPLGAFWTTNPGRHGLESYRPDGELLSAWYRPAMGTAGFCGCSNPAHIAFLPDGTLVTAEHGLSRVKLYSPDQQFLMMVAGPETFGESPGMMLPQDQEPAIRDLLVDEKGRILVLDAKKAQLRIFEKKKGMP